MVWCGATVRKKLDIKIGDIFDRLEIMEIIPGKNVMVRCVCNPDIIYSVNRSSVYSGVIKSCGCLKREFLINMITKHGYHESDIYKIYRHMVMRCFDKKYNLYHNYGGRGITICQDWNPRVLEYSEAFINFKMWADNHGFKKGLTIDRIDPDNHYCPHNCQFITLKEQLNNKRSTKLYTLGSITKSLTKWTEDPICVTNYENLYYRIKAGWDLKSALTTLASLRNKRRRKK